MQIVSNNKYTTDVVDVSTFFSDLIDGYADLEKNAHLISAKAFRLTPLQIESQCARLRSMRENLKSKDCKLLEIIDFAGSEIANHRLLDDYRVALAGAAEAVEILREELRLVRIGLEEHLDI